MPTNETGKGIVEGLAAAHTAYSSSSSTKILFVTQPNERNIFDQRHLQYLLQDTHNIRTIRRTFTQLSTCASLHPTTNALIVDGEEISVVYYRAGYTPDDFFGEEEWQARFLLERSEVSSPCST